MSKDARVMILGVRVSVTSISRAVLGIGHWIKERQRTYVCVAPVSTLVDCQRNLAYRDVVNAAGMVTPDGMPLVWIAKAKGCKDIERTYGPDLMRAVCEQGQAQSWRHFFYGGTPDVCAKLETVLKKNFPCIKIVGVFSPPFRSQAEQEQADVLKTIQEAKPDILWVALGSPKQDFWMQMHRPLLDVPVMVGVGAAFDFVAGIKPQAPLWMQHSGLEWLFRLLTEPKRLWRRYLIGNTKFIYYLIKDMLQQH